MNVGSLCTGYAGLDLALDMLLDVELAWYSEIDKDASRLLEHRFPGVLNLGDLKRIDWAAVRPVECLTAGYPCQPFSHAGKRQGTDDPRHLWPFIHDAIRVLRPRLVVLENVAGHLSLGFDTVLADLAGLGFDAEWGTLRASDVGACHGRNRLWVVATDTRGERHGRWQDPPQWDAWTERMMDEHGNGNGHGRSLSIEVARLLPTPRVAANRTSAKALAEGSSAGPSLDDVTKAATGDVPHNVGRTPSWDAVRSLLPTPPHLRRERDRPARRWGRRPADSGRQAAPDAHRRRLEERMQLHRQPDI